MKNLVFLLIALFAFTACRNTTATDEAKETSRDQLAEEIIALQETLRKQIDNPTIDTGTVRSAAEKTLVYAERFPQDSLTPQFLFNAADASRGIGDYERAVDLWGQITQEYEGYKRAPEALFFQAFTFDENLRDTAQARQKYEAFLEKYPKHPIANDARMLLKAVKSGKSPEELVKEFEQQREQEEEK